MVAVRANPSFAVGLLVIRDICNISLPGFLVKILVYNKSVFVTGFIYNTLRN